jgi:HSP20 family protein
MTLTRYIRPQGMLKMMDDLMDMRSTLDSLFTGRDGAEGTYTPPMNAYGTADEIILELELAGVESKDSEINVVEDVMTIKAKRELPTLHDNQFWFRQERPSGEWMRSIKLPFKADIDKVSATFKNGILRVTIPRTESERPKRIEIKSS